MTSNGHFKVVGVPGAGKSGLVISLDLALKARGITCSAFEIEPYSDTHDIIRGLKLASERKRLATATMADIQPRLERYERARSQIVLGDLAGWLGGDNLMPNILFPGDAVILVQREPLPGDKTTNAEWEKLLVAKGVDVAVRVQSRHAGQELMPNADVVVERLDRTANPHATGLRELADWLIARSVPGR